MSPIQFEVKKAHIEREASQARTANDLAGLQAAMAEMTALLRSYYGPHTGQQSATNCWFGSVSVGLRMDMRDSEPTQTVLHGAVSLG
jgi:hypothetical protein